MVFPAPARSFRRLKRPAFETPRLPLNRVCVRRFATVEKFRSQIIDSKKEQLVRQLQMYLPGIPETPKHSGSGNLYSPQRT
jgi:hypothetical protein